MFNIIELMSMPSFDMKRLSYNIAPLIAADNDELMTLMPNIFRKDLRNITDPNVAAISINCLSKICNEELA